MKMIDLGEAKSHLEEYAQECHSSPIVVTINGKPAFEMLPIRADDPSFIDRLLTSNEAFRQLAEKRKVEADQGKVVSLDCVRQRWTE